MNRHRSVRRTGLLAAGCTLALACGLVSTPAVAYFTSGGVGTGAAPTGTVQPLEILSATIGSPTMPLYPGTTGDVVLKLTNPNSTPVTLRSVSQSGGVSVDGGKGCTDDPQWPTTVGTSGVSILEVTALNVVVAAGSTQELLLPGAASMTAASAAGCQGATFDIPVTVEAIQ